MPSPYTLEDAHAWIALAAVERERGTGLHVVSVSTADERVVGAAALRLHERPRAHAEVGYWVAADARRSGFGARAVTLLTDYARGELGLPYVEIVIAPENEPSLALARRCGFAERGRELRDFKGALAEFTLWRQGEGP